MFTKSNKRAFQQIPNFPPNLADITFSFKGIHNLVNLIISHVFCPTNKPMTVPLKPVMVAKISGFQV